MYNLKRKLHHLLNSMIWRDFSLLLYLVDILFPSYWEVIVIISPVNNFDNNNFTCLKVVVVSLFMSRAWLPQTCEIHLRCAFFTGLFEGERLRYWGAYTFSCRRCSADADWITGKQVHPSAFFSPVCHAVCFPAASKRSCCLARAVFRWVKRGAVASWWDSWEAFIK